MIKSAIAAAVFSVAFVAPALAAPWQCDEANLNEMKDYVGKLDSPAAQQEGLTEWEHANSALRAKNMEECSARMANVNKLLGGKDLERAQETQSDTNTTTTQ